MNEDPNTILGETFAQLEAAWNDADGARFASRFSEDAHFVDIRGVRHRGSTAIGQGHQAIFDTVYKGSKVQYSPLDCEVITSGCLLGVVRARLEAPSGPLEGVHLSTVTAVLVEVAANWKVRAFHNTLLTE